MSNVKLIAYTQDAEKLVAASAKLCYSASQIDEIMSDLTPEKVDKFMDMLNQIGHESPIEHANFTFAIEGVSRAFLAQITRHRIASYSVQSQRYVNESDFSYIYPEEISNIPEAKAIFEEAMKSSGEYYNKLSNILKQKHLDALLKENNLNVENIDSKLLKKYSNIAEKKANEDARFVLPNACETKMMVTMNARSLRNFFRHRCCNRAQWEIREVAEKMLVEVKQVAPLLFNNAGPSCISGKCPEGKMTCGKIEEVRNHYRNILK